MSAINDALRRASSAAKTPPGSPSAQAPLPSTNEPPPSGASAPDPIVAPPIIATPDISLPPLIDSSKKRSKLPLILALLFVLCLGGGAALYFFGKGQLVALAREKAEKHDDLSVKEQLAALFGDPEVAAKAENVRSNQVAAKPQPSVAPAAPEPAPKPAPPVATVPKSTSTSAHAAPRGSVPFPPLRLQSIFYRPGSPSVMINGKTLFVTDEINGVLVADIQPSSVTLVLSGQTNVLTLR